MDGSMCAKCVSEKECGCGCLEHLAIVQDEFYPFDIIKINCDECEHVVASANEQPH